MNRTQYVLQGADKSYYARGKKLWLTTSPALAAAMCIIAEKECKQKYTVVPLYE